MNAVIAGGNGQLRFIGDGQFARAVQPVVHAIQRDAVAGDGHIAAGLETLGAGGGFLRGILLCVEPAGEAESLHMLWGIGGTAAGDRRNAAGQQCEVGAGLNAVALGGDV